MRFLRQLIRQLDGNLEEWRRRQVASRELSRMPEWQLLDIGIEPHMIDSFLNAIAEGRRGGKENRHPAKYPELRDKPDRAPRQPIGAGC